MRRFSLAAAAVVAAAACAGVALGSDAPVPVGVNIPVVLTEQVSSETAHVGDAFTYKTSKEVKLGELTVASGTPGHGRLSIAQPAGNGHDGSLWLQADALDLPGGRTLWVNIDPAKRPVGHLSKHNLVLDPGAEFTVVTIAPRRAPAPLLTASPQPPAPAPSPAAS